MDTYGTVTDQLINYIQFKNLPEKEILRHDKNNKNKTEKNSRISMKESKDRNAHKNAFTESRTNIYNA